MFSKVNKRLPLICSLIVLMTSAVFPAAVYGEKFIRVAGSGAGLAAMKLLSAAFEKSHPGVKIQICSRMGSSGAIKALMDGAIDLTVSSRPLRNNEAVAGLTAVEYARTPFVFVANKDVTKNGLTTEELEKIYSGRMLTWPDGRRIRLVLHLEAETEAKIVKGISPGMEQAVKAVQSRPGMIFAAASDESDELVEKTSGSFGVSTLAQIVTLNRPVKILSFNGVKPSVKALADGSYRLFKPLCLVTASAASAEVRQFVKFVRSREGRRILVINGYLVVGGNGGAGHE